jgi:hypothetical protein
MQGEQIFANEYFGTAIGGEAAYPGLSWTYRGAMRPVGIVGGRDAITFNAAPSKSKRVQRMGKVF